MPTIQGEAEELADGLATKFVGAANAGVDLFVGNVRAFVKAMMWHDAVLFLSAAVVPRGRWTEYKIFLEWNK